MHMQAHYDPAQDRIMLRLRDSASAEGSTLWLTRRQWTQIALACRQVAAASAPEEKAERPRKKVAEVGKEQAGGQREGGSSAAAARTTVVGKNESRAAAATASLVSRIRFRRLPSGLRIEMASDAPAPLALTLKGESLATFADLVERLAAKATWDLGAAMLRIGHTSAARKRMLH